jgi:hypothetical protein
MGLLTETNEQYYEGPDEIWNSLDENYGGYQFISIKDIINNFIIAYVGEEKIISKLKRTDVAFHAQRGIQELSFDLLPAVQTQEIELSPQLFMVLPQDYVNYVKFTWTDNAGIERVIYPAIKTSDPLPILQDNEYEYLFDSDGNILYANESETLKRFNQASGYRNPDIENYNQLDNLFIQNYGRRYGSTPENMQSNGTFFIDQNRGLVHFSSDLVGRIITIKYISDGLASDEDMVVHKFAEETIYLYIAYAVLSTRNNTPEYIVNRFKKQYHASRRNSKLRLSNIKIEEITQVMRNKSKHIKH